MYNRRVPRPRWSYPARRGGGLLPTPAANSLVEDVAGRRPQGGRGGDGPGGGGVGSKPQEENAIEKEVTTKAQQPPVGPTLPSNYVTLAQLQEQRRLKLEGQRKEDGDQAAAEEAEARLRRRLEGEEDEPLLLQELKPQGEKAWEKEVTTKAQQPPSGLTLPSNYVTLAQLQEQRRLKVEGRRKEDGGQAAAADAEARLRMLPEKEEEEPLLLREPKKEGKSGEREEAPWPGRGGAALARSRRGGRSSPTQWQPKNGGAPSGGVAGATGPGGRQRGGRGRANGRGKEGEPREGRGRSGNRRGSERTKLGAAAARSDSAISAVGEVDPQDRSDTEDQEDVMPRPIDAEDGGNLQQIERGGGPPSQMKVEEQEGNADSASCCRGQEGTKVTQRHFQSRVGKVGWGAKHCEPLQPANGIVHVACKLKDMSIITMAREDKGATGGSDGGDLRRRRSTVGRGGGYVGFRGNRALVPWHRSRSAGDRTMWVRKTEIS